MTRTVIDGGVDVVAARRRNASEKGLTNVQWKCLVGDGPKKNPH